MHKKIVISVILLAALYSVSLNAQTPLDRGSLKVPSLISPYYFGPNAFPIPDFLDGSESSNARVEIGGDYFAGFQKDKTTDLYCKLSLPLFSDRAKLSLWMPIYEWWNTSIERQTITRTLGRQSSGKLLGDIYLSTDITILRGEENGFDLILRAALKSASGGDFELARYYDCPGYFFDVAIAKGFDLGGELFKEFRLGASTGFLCWQTNNGRQNDAVMYGLSAKLSTENFSLRESFGGYLGWEKNAAIDKNIHCGDCPMSLKTDLIYSWGAFEFLLRHQVGLADWPFHQFRFGVAYNFAD